MANQITMAMNDSIITLYAKGWSRRRIARVLDINRETVARYLRLASKPAILTPCRLGSNQRITVKDRDKGHVSTLHGRAGPAFVLRDYGG